MKVKQMSQGRSTGGPRSRSAAGYERIAAKEEADKQAAAKKKARLDRLKEAGVSRYKKETRDYSNEAIYDPPGSAGYKFMKFLRQNIRDPIEDTLSDVYGTKAPEGIEGPEAANLRARREQLGYKKGGRIDGCAIRGKTRA